jgi:hypothetical protein
MWFVVGEKMYKNVRRCHGSHLKSSSEHQLPANIIGKHQNLNQRLELFRSKNHKPSKWAPAVDATSALAQAAKTALAA